MAIWQDLVDRHGFTAHRDVLAHYGAVALPGVGHAKRAALADSQAHQLSDSVALADPLAELADPLARSFARR
jgi:hypothetical protein